MLLRWSTVSSPLLALCLAAGLALPVEARQAGGKGAKRPTEKSPRNSETPIDDFLHMTPEEQRQALDRLPPGQRMRLQQKLDKFNQLPPQQQQRLRTMYDRLNQLPQARQSLVRRSLNEFSQQPADRRQAMRQELRKLAPLGPRDREARMSSAEFRQKFSEKEQRMVSDMSDLLPDR
jgi:TolA-binding protein